MLWQIQVNGKGTQPHIHMYPFFRTLPSHPGCQMTLSRVPCVVQQNLSTNPFDSIGPLGLYPGFCLGHHFAHSQHLRHTCIDWLEKEMATHSSVLAWRIPGTKEPGGLPSMGSHRVGHDWSDLAAATLIVKSHHSIFRILPGIFFLLYIISNLQSESYTLEIN